MREHYRWSSDDVLKLPGFIADALPDLLPLDDQVLPLMSFSRCDMDTNCVVSSLITCARNTIMVG